MAFLIEHGLNVNVLPGTVHGEPDAVGDIAGAKWTRMVFFYSRHFNMNDADAFAYYDRIVDKYAQAGIRVLFILIQDTFWGNGPWNDGNYPQYAGDFARVCGKIAAHFAGKGLAYQIWNEPDHHQSSIGLSPENYALILTQAGKAIKAADVNALVITAGMATGADAAVQYLNTVRQNCPNGRLPADAVAIHLYGQYVGSSQPTDDVQPGGITGSLIDTLRAYKKGLPGLPVWITEIGIVNPDDNFRWNDAQNTAIAAYIRAVLTYIQRFHNDWIKAVIWFAWGDIMENGGLVDLAGNQKEEYRSYFDTLRGLRVEDRPYMLTPVQTMNVRQQDYQHFTITGSIPATTALKVLDPPALALAKLNAKTEDQWICVEHPDTGQPAWVGAWLMRVVPAADPAAPMSIRVKQGSGINLRSGNLTQLDLVGQLQPGDKLFPLEDPSIAFAKVHLTTGEATPRSLMNWVSVETPAGQRAWVAAWYLQPHAESQTPPPLLESPLAVVVDQPPVESDDQTTLTQPVAPAMISGKGMLIWQLWQIKAKSPAELVALARSADLDHILIKIADGEDPYPVPGPNQTANMQREALVQDAITAFQAAGITVWGWAYIYGPGGTRDIRKQAQRLAQRVIQFNLPGVVIDAEKEFKVAGSADAAETFMQTLKQAFSDAGRQVLTALSSYRFMHLHAAFPFDAFMKYCDVVMPQVYWAESEPASNLKASYDEYQQAYPDKPFIPTGAAYFENGWTPTPDEITTFLKEAAQRKLTAVNFYSWQHARFDSNNPTYSKTELWDAIAAYPYPPEIAPEGTSEPATETAGVVATTTTVTAKTIDVTVTTDAATAETTGVTVTTTTITTETIAVIATTDAAAAATTTSSQPDATATSVQPAAVLPPDDRETLVPSEATMKLYTSVATTQPNLVAFPATPSFAPLSGIPVNSWGAQFNVLEGVAAADLPVGVRVGPDDYNSCGPVTVAAMLNRLVGSEQFTPQQTLLEMFKIINTYDANYPNRHTSKGIARTTYMDELVELVKQVGGEQISPDSQAIAQGKKSTLLADFQTHLSNGRVIISLVHILGANQATRNPHNGHLTFGALDGIGHWVAIDSIARRDGSDVWWARVYNPFPNAVEYYPFDYLFLCLLGSNRAFAKA